MTVWTPCCEAAAQGRVCHHIEAELVQGLRDRALFGVPVEEARRWLLAELERIQGGRLQRPGGATNDADREDGR